MFGVLSASHSWFKDLLGTSTALEYPQLPLMNVHKICKFADPAYLLLLTGSSL